MAPALRSVPWLAPGGTLVRRGFGGRALLARRLAAVATACFAASAPHVAAAEPPQQLLDEALRAHRVILLGEVHDNPAQHALRLTALRALLAAGARPALLMEQFDRERQPDLDRAAAQPGATADEVIAAAAAPGAGWQWPLYRPFVALALEYRLPLVAANVSRAESRGVMAAGLAASGFSAEVPFDIESAQTQAMVEGHCGMLDASQARRMALAQIARDQFMARLVQSHAQRGAVLLAGNGHVRRDIGVPRWLSGPARAAAVSIGLQEASVPQAESYDVVLSTAAQPRPDPCAAMAMRRG